MKETKYALLDDYEHSPLFSERERVALRYADAITWDPSRADDVMWADLHAHFDEAELVELGAVIALISGTQRWIHTLDLQHGEVLFETTGGLSEAAATRLHGS